MWWHSETGESPRQRYEQTRPIVRHVNVQQILKYLLGRERRTPTSPTSNWTALRFPPPRRLRGSPPRPAQPTENLADLFPRRRVPRHGEAARTRYRKFQIFTPEACGPAAAQPPAANPQARGGVPPTQREEQPPGGPGPSNSPRVDFTQQLTTHLARPGGPMAVSTGELERLQKL